MHADLTSELVAALDVRSQAQAVLDEAECRVRSAVVTLSAQGQSLGQIADVMSCSRQAVSQMLKRASKADQREWEDSQDSKRWDAYCDREQAKSERGLVRGSIPCEHCGRFKARPADECGYCGSTLLTHNGNAANLNRAYGYAA